jgi:hypothetical protein
MHGLKLKRPLSAGPFAYLSLNFFTKKLFPYLKHPEVGQIAFAN